MTFSELALNEQLLDGLDAMGFETATPIQEKAIPVILEGKDFISFGLKPRFTGALGCSIAMAGICHANH